MTYTVLRGAFVIRYADLPRQGPEPDGDTVKFLPDDRDLVEELPLTSGRPPKLGAHGVSVRLEAVDALETHFAGTHQELAGANAARDRLLASLGFTGVKYFPSAPNRVESADQDKIRGHVLSNGVDSNGRVIGFVYAGEAVLPVDRKVFVDEPLVEKSVNATLLRDGLVYAAYYGSLPATLRTHLADISRRARLSKHPDGIWPRATADPEGPAEVVDLAGLQQLVMWPKLFRRLVSYLAEGNASLDGFDRWLRADPVNRDDSLFLLDRLEFGNLHDVISASGSSIALTAWPEDFIIEPDPAPVGAMAEAPGTPATVA
ncbi:MAG TPA: hypothetical protein VEQ66_10185 [Propionibacteriaceae bacterium]|nr:hypothetical protein [Propionibacteriaceae bacterium]